MNDELVIILLVGCSGRLVTVDSLPAAHQDREHVLDYRVQGIGCASDN
ncbi:MULTISPECIES: hypothetical protein [Pseudomonas]|nr:MULTISPECIES: hypothetical protein [Pseudomonas]MBY8929228.1 hypothetical protein [Pseudomonas sp. Wu6]